MKTTKLLAAILLIAAFAAFALGSGEDSSSNSAASPSPTQSQTTTGDATGDTTAAPTEATKSGFGIGEAAVQQDVTVTLLSVTESTGSSYNTPADGNVFVLCEFELENNSEKELNVSSMLSFEAYCDDYSCTFSLGALMEKGNQNQLDGTVAPGKKFKGVIGYEVPTDWQTLEIHFTPDVWFGKSMVFVATHE